MAQINFNYRVDMNNIEGPQDPSGFIVGYDWNLSGTATQSFTGGIEYFALGSSYLESKAVVIKSIFE